MPNRKENLHTKNQPSGQLEEQQRKSCLPKTIQTDISNYRLSSLLQTMTYLAVVKVTPNISQRNSILYRGLIEVHTLKTKSLNDIIYIYRIKMKNFKI